MPRHTLYAMIDVYGLLQLKEGGEGLAGILVVDDSSCLAHGVHPPHGVTHIDATHGKLRGEDIAQGRASSHVGVVDEILAGHLGEAAYLGKDSGALGIGDILLVGIDLDHGAATHHGVVGGVMLAGVVGVQGMSHIGRDHE